MYPKEIQTLTVSIFLLIIGFLVHNNIPAFTCCALSIFVDFTEAQKELILIQHVKFHIVIPVPNFDVTFIQDREKKCHQYGTYSIYG